MKNLAVLLIHCKDRKGLIYRITEYIYKYNGNTVDLDEHVEKLDNIFSMRVAWELEGFEIPKEKIGDYFERDIGSIRDIKWELYFTSETPKMAIFVSKESHCLYDILSRYDSKEWNVEIPAIISNHEIHKDLADRYNIPFYHFPINKENKVKVEKEQLKLLQSLDVDLIILARYMQILSGNFINAYKNRIINIHHSFLPAFAGAKPYHRAHERGVKIIGATSHYVTEDLDAGPILEQEVVRISHKDSITDLIRKGKDLEKIVLSRAIFTHLQRKVLVHNNKAVIFD